MKKIKKFIIVLFPLISSCSNFQSLDVISVNIKANENYVREFYDDLQKNEFMIFESKESIINYFNSGNYDANSLSLSDIHTIFNDDLFRENYITLLNLVISTSSTVKTEQDNNLIIYHIYGSNIATDGFVFTTIINPVKKINNTINEFKYVVYHEK